MEDDVMLTIGRLYGTVLSERGYRKDSTGGVVEAALGAAVVALEIAKDAVKAHRKREKLRLIQEAMDDAAL